MWNKLKKYFYIIYIYYNVTSYLNLVTATDIQNESNNDVCVLKGVCKQTEYGTIPCEEKRQPIILKQIPQNIKSISLLEVMCPHLYGDDDMTVCCDELQLESMYVIIYNLAHYGLNHCPSCLKNLEKLFCQLNCSPKQNQFVKVRKVKKDESGNYLAAEVDYYISESYALGIFNSCKDVRNSKGKVLDMMCGGLKAEDCTVKDWLDYIGQSIEDDGMSPFRINFHITNETVVEVGKNAYKPVHDSYVKCSEPISNDSKACDCQHCPDSCNNNSSSQESKNAKISKAYKKNGLRRDKRQSNKCLMRGVCGETAFGAIPCVSDEEPAPISDPVALGELREMCPHLVTSDTPTVCCTADQVIRLNQTFEMLSMFLKRCPSCVRNFEKVICHLSCATDQQTFMRITQTSKNDDDKDMVSEVEYFVNDDWIKGVYDSCKGVHRLGFNVLDHYCKPYKSQDCNHQKFLQFIGGDAEHFGHSPFEINFIFTNDESVDSNGVKYKPVKQSFYKCSDNPHTGEGKCPCMHCDESCAPGEAKNIERQLPKFSPKTKREIQIDGTSDRTELLENDSDIIGQRFPQIEFDSQDEYCIFDGVCSHDSRAGNVPCMKIKEPKAISDRKTVETLEHICPELVTDRHPMTCCDASQIHHLYAAFKLPAELGLEICPSCLYNFRKILCQFACSPRQNQLIRIVNATKLDGGKTLIDHVEYYMNADFAQGLYDSCKSIHNGNVINMMCGKWGRKKQCTPQRWLDFMGLSTKNGGYSPFQMDVKLTTESNVTVNGQTFYPMNEKAFSCAELPTPGSIPCGCANCEEACM